MSFAIVCANFSCSNTKHTNSLKISPEILLTDNLFWFCDTCKRELQSQKVICNNILTKEIEPEVQPNQDTNTNNVSSVYTEPPTLNILTDIIRDIGLQVSYLTTDRRELRQQLDNIEAHSKKCNIEITGIPYRSNEKVEDIFHKVTHLLDINQEIASVNRIYRIKPSDNNNTRKSIIVEFCKQSSRDTFLTKAKTSKNLLLSNLGFQDTTYRFFINEHLTRLKKEILYQLKKHKEAVKYDRLWIRDGQIYVRFPTKVVNVASREILNGLLRL